MAGVKYYNGANYGGWRDFEDYPHLIKKWNGSSWTESQIKISKWSGTSWVQLFPKIEVIATKTFTASNLKYTNTTFTTIKTWNSGRAGGGTWEDKTYIGWLGLVGEPINGTIKNITIDYTRYGAGKYEYELPIQLCQTTLTSPYGTGPASHKTKIAGTVITTDTKMKVIPEGLHGSCSGTVAIVSQAQIEQVNKWLNSGKYLVVGTPEVGTEYIQLTAMKMNINYVVPVYLALFPLDKSKKKSNNPDDFAEMYIYEEEQGLELDEIIERRKRLNINDIVIEK